MVGHLFEFFRKFSFSEIVDEKPIDRPINASISLDRKTILGLLFGLFFILLYNLYFVNSFTPWTEGWFVMFAFEMNHGKVLYKDLYHFMPPLYPKLMALFTGVFGYEIINIRVLGILVILGFSSCLFFIFSQFTNLIAAAIMTVIVTIYYQHGTAHIAYDFFQVMNLAFVASCLAAIWSFKLDASHRFKSRDFAILFSGLFLSIAAQIKHSNGSVVGLLTFLTVSAFAILAIKNKAIHFLSYYIIGCSLPFLFLLTDLLLSQTTAKFVEQVFAGAIAAKGGTNQIFLGWLANSFSIYFLEQAKEIFAFLSLTGFILFMILPDLADLKHPIASIWNMTKSRLVISSGIIVSFVLLFFYALYSSRALPFHIESHYLYDMQTAAILSPLVFCLFSFRSLKGSQKTIGIFLSLFSLFLMVGNGTSNAISEGGAYLGFGLVLLLLLKVPSFFNLNYLFFIPILCMMAISIREKKSIPYSWWNVTAELNTTEPVYQGDILGGFKLNHQQIQVINSVNDVIRKYSKSDDDIIAFPHIPIFYLLNNKRIPSHAVVHWFDFLPDTLAAKEASELERKDIHVIIELDFGEEVWLAHEKGFRAGRESGQRQIQEVLNAKKIKNKMTSREIKLSEKTKLIVSYF